MATWISVKLIEPTETDVSAILIQNVEHVLD